MSQETHGLSSPCRFPPLTVRLVSLLVSTLRDYGGVFHWPCATLGASGLWAQTLHASADLLVRRSASFLRLFFAFFSMWLGEVVSGGAVRWPWLFCVRSGRVFCSLGGICFLVR
jgi:hypothetical protein